MRAAKKPTLTHQPGVDRREAPTRFASSSSANTFSCHPRTSTMRVRDRRFRAGHVHGGSLPGSWPPTTCSGMRKASPATGSWPDATGVLIIGESVVGGTPIPLVYELLGLGRRLSEGVGNGVSVLMLGNPATDPSWGLSPQGRTAFTSRPRRARSSTSRSGSRRSRPALGLRRGWSSRVLRAAQALRLGWRFSWRAIASGCVLSRVSRRPVACAETVLRAQAREIISLHTISPSVATMPDQEA